MRFSSLFKEEHHRPTRKIEFCPAELSSGGGHVSGYVADLSRQGTQINGKNTDFSKLGLKSGDKLEVSIKTAYGFSRKKGTVQWVEHDSDRFKVGMHFDDLINASDDPVTLLMESAVA